MGRQSTDLRYVLHLHQHEWHNEPTLGCHNWTGIQVERANDRREEFIGRSAKLRALCAHIAHGDVKQGGADVRKPRESLHTWWVGRP